MCLQTNKARIYLFLILFIVSIIIVFPIAIVWNDMALLFVIVIPVMIVFPLWWIAFGREIMFTEEGIVVRFLCFRKMYRWSQMKTKKRKQIIIGSGPYVSEIYNGLLFSCRKVWIPWAKLFPDVRYSVPTLHPFSLVFVLFEPNLVPPVQWPKWAPKWLKQGQERGLHSGYFADEEQLFSLLHSWGVTLDDE